VPSPFPFAEELYTSKLDISKISRRDQERAARLEREILHGGSGGGRHGGGSGGGGGGPLAGNIHMMEERGTEVDTGLTEEER
jgi:PAB1-binding protein PBP1